MPSDLPFTLRVAGVWLIYSAWAAATGWTLSMLHALNATGCTVAAIPLLLGTTWWWLATNESSRPFKLRWHVFTRRLRRFPPFAAWISISLLVLAGGLLNPPSNYDALTYRMPRLFYWLQENHWYWIGALNFRMDIAGTGFEWMSLPFFAFGNGERALFILNFIPFLLLPGLFWVAATGLGIRPRNVRWWMWVWPLSFGIVLQAASVGNDMVGAALALASLAFAMQARKSSPMTCLVFSALAAALMTSIKVTMLPLGLPLAVAWIWVAMERLGFLKTAALGALCAVSLVPFSFAPVAIQCIRNTGKWTGNPDNRLKIEVAHPLAGLVGNGLHLVFGSIAPPVFPGSATFNQTTARVVDGSKLFQWTATQYPFYLPPRINELPSEEGAGIGIGVTLVAICWIGAMGLRKPDLNTASFGKPATWILVATLVAALIFLAKVGGNSSPRLMLPFTPFCILAVLAIFPGSGRYLADYRLALLPGILVLPALFINPNRPLIPVQLLYSSPGLSAPLKSRMQKVYEGYSHRGNILAPMAEMLPKGQSVGFAGELDHSPMSLFRMHGAGRVIELMPSTLGSIDWIVGTRRGIEQRLAITPDEWSRQNVFELKAELPLVSRVSTGAEIWCLYRRTE